MILMHLSLLLYLIYLSICSLRNHFIRAIFFLFIRLIIIWFIFILFFVDLSFFLTLLFLFVFLQIFTHFFFLFYLHLAHSSSDVIPLRANSSINKSNEIFFGHSVSFLTYKLQKINNIICTSFFQDQPFKFFLFLSNFFS